ncbi:hypothetical protein QF042_001967 [Pedobacter sp. W3I1]|uniref:fibronectin type III-like domain-contianing protein n=1 Tax=Pedobacter sp. W3I1 TaxID=3042291 RepID=UPI0027879B39|nr:fibronectin type III-like domain-contianing protein [Pedobacter sp. W3I1]MDQ0638402.1 hypothetical protein [Pedobacter sp. W3I1]
MNKSKSSTGGLTVEFDLKNIGPVTGDEVAQLYLNRQNASVVMPVQELKGFKRISLKAGESQHLVFEVKAEDLKIYNAEMQWVNEDLDLNVMVGPSSDNIALSARLK